LKYILALDQGTTSSRAILFDHTGSVRSISQREFAQIYPRPGWVEHDPAEILSSQMAVASEALQKAGARDGEVAAIGITNQRETTIVWDRKTGRPVTNAIVWQDRRTAKMCDDLRAAGHTETFRRKTGLVLDAYFSGTKLAWILENTDGVRERAENGELAFGTVDTWLIWNLTEGRVHATDPSNASRTLLYNIQKKEWDQAILSLLNIPRSLLPDVLPSSYVFGEGRVEPLDSPIPIAGTAGDQQAALFGQVCTRPGMVKNTYGTGCFMLMQTGTEPVTSENNLLTTVAWQLGDRMEYALEGSVFVAGAVVQWLRDGLGIIESAPDIEALAESVPDNGGVYVVPAFTGLGAPHWDQYARGTITGLTRGSTRAHIARAALECIAFQSADLIRAMEKDSGLELAELRVDGGATTNDLLMQIQADLLGVSVVRPKVLETTALGAAYLAGLAVGFWSGLDEIAAQWQVDRSFFRTSTTESVATRMKHWTRALERAKDWAREEA